MTEKPFDGMKERRDAPLYEHRQAGIGYITGGAEAAANAAAEHIMGRIARTQALADRLSPWIDVKDEDIVYEAIDTLRVRWREARLFDGSVPLPQYRPPYQSAVADRDEFGARVIKLRRRLRKKLRQLRRLQRELRNGAWS